MAGTVLGPARSPFAEPRNPGAGCRDLRTSESVIDPVPDCVCDRRRRGCESSRLSFTWGARYYRGPARNAAAGPFLCAMQSREDTGLSSVTASRSHVRRECIGQHPRSLAECWVLSVLRVRGTHEKDSASWRLLGVRARTPRVLMRDSPRRDRGGFRWSTHSGGHS